MPEPWDPSPASPKPATWLVGTRRRVAVSGALASTLAGQTSVTSNEYTYKAVLGPREAEDNQLFHATPTLPCYTTFSGVWITGVSRLGLYKPASWHQVSPIIHRWCSSAKPIKLWVKSFYDWGILVTHLWEWHSSRVFGRVERRPCTPLPRRGGLPGALITEIH